MTTARTICTRALRRLGAIDVLATPAAEDMASANDALGEMLSLWRTHGVDVLVYSFALDDQLAFFVPPSGMAASVIDIAELAGSWNASTNSPALVSSTGTTGQVYRVTTAGSTVLDDVATWAVGEFAVYDGTEWLKGKSADRHDAAVIALLAVRIASEFGIEPPEQVQRDAMHGWSSIQADYVKPALAGFDSGLLVTQSRRIFEVLE